MYFGRTCSGSVNMATNLELNEQYFIRQLCNVVRSVNRHY